MKKKSPLPAWLITSPILAITIYFTEWILFSQHTIGINKQELKTLLSYLVIATAASLVGSVFIKKRGSRFSAAIYYRQERSWSELFKIMGIALIFISLFILRAVVTYPTLYKETLLKSDFFLFPIFKTVTEGFSPLYFTVLIFIMIIILFYNLFNQLLNGMEIK